MYGISVYIYFSVIVAQSCPNVCDSINCSLPGSSTHGITRWSILKSDGLYSLQPKMEALFSQRKQDWELTVAQIMNALLLNSDLNRIKYGKSLDDSGMT